MARYFYNDDNTCIGPRYDLIEEFNDGFLKQIKCPNCKNITDFSEWGYQKKNDN